MKKNVFVVGLALAVAGLGLMVLMQGRQMQAQREAHANESAVLKEQLAAAVKAARAESKKALAAAAERPGSVASRPAPPQARTAEPAAPAVAQTAGMSTNFMGAIADMMKNPQMKEMVLAQQKVVVGQMYSGLSRYLNLSPEMKERLDKLLLDRQMALTDSGLAMMSGTAEERKMAAEASKTVKAEYDQAIQELLGSQDYEVLKQYEESLSEQTSVSLFKNTLTGDDVITEQQEYDLVSAMVQARKELPQDSLFNQQNQAQDPSQMTPERIDEAIKQMEVLQQRYAEQAATVLNAAQMERFRQWQQQMATMQRAGLSMAAQMFGQGQSSAPAK